MIIGFTGSQKGMTDFQHKEVEWILTFYKRSITEIHHGGCIGADTIFHSICSEFGLPTPIIHPASDVNPSKKAILIGANYLPAKPALKRNHDIVDIADIMIATPGETHEVWRSGTWATIRYARKIGKVIHLICP